jgi:hypothetical protein
VSRLRGDVIDKQQQRGKQQCSQSIQKGYFKQCPQAVEGWGALA